MPSSVLPSWLDPGTRKGLVGAAALLWVMTVVAYLPALGGGFVFDDRMYITEDSRMESAGGLVRIWTELQLDDVQHQYYPMTSSAFWVQHQLWGKHPFGYHLVNVLLHAANAVLLWRLLRTVRLPGAWLAAAVFGVHPVHVESVAWIVELKNVLSTLFVLGAALAFVRFYAASDARGERDLGRPAAEPRDWSIYGVGMALFLCALLSKSATCLLPAALLLLLWWKRDHLVRRDLLALLPLVVLGAGAVTFTVYMESHYVGAQGEAFSQSWIARCLVAGRALWFYAGKLAWPHPLVFIYPRWDIDSSAWWQYLYPCAAVAALGILWHQRARIGKGPLVAVTFFVLAAAPISFVNVFFSQYSYVADHWQYWASMGLIALAAAAAAALTHWPGGRRAVPVAAAITLSVLSVLTWRRAEVYESRITLWADTVEKNPSAWIAHNNLGVAFLAAGETDAAIVQFRETLALRPAAVRARYNLGLGFRLQGRLEEAIREYRLVLRIAPNIAKVHNNLGEALELQGRTEAAIMHYREAVRVEPDFAFAHNNLANRLRDGGRLAAAIEHYRQAIHIAPGFATAHDNLGATLAMRGELDEAIVHFREACRIDPGNAGALVHLASALEARDAP